MTGIMLGMGKEIASGVVFIGGVVTAALSIETLPVVAGVAAVTALGAGVYQAVSTAHKTKQAKEAGLLR